MRKEDLRIVYMGTPDFAVESLKALVEGGYNIVGVVTMPDKPMGRHGSVSQPSAVKRYAASVGLPVLQPEKLKDERFLEELRALRADLQIVVAFRMLPEVVWAMPRLGTFNLHASLLPQYRGAAPIQWAVLNGENESGVTTMQMDEGLDTGDMLLKEAVPIGEDETDESLYKRLSSVGGRLIVEALKRLEEGSLDAEKQDDSASCYAKMLHKEMGKIDWNRPAKELERQVRGLYTWPGAYTGLKGKLLKIREAKADPESPDAEPGTVSRVTKDAVWVNTGEGKLILKEVQLEGKKRMAVRDFLLGCKIGKGEKLQCL